MLASYTWGSQARHLGNLPPKKRHAVVQQALGLIHPQINQEGVLRRMESWYWDKHPWSLAGFTFMKPYQQLGLYKDVVAPEGRIYFAREHTSTQSAWIEGAVESSLRAVKEMLVAG